MDWPTRDILTHRARATADATALVRAETGEPWSVGELDAAVDRAATEVVASLDDSTSGDRPRVAIAAATTPAFVVSLFAAWRAGAVAVPLALDEGRSRLARVEPALAIDPGDGGFAAAEPECPVIDSTDADGSEGVSASPWTPDEPCLLLFTSGTTGRPKGVWLTHGNLVASAMASAFRLGLHRGDRWYCALPTNHMGGLAPIVRSMLAGTAVVLDATTDPSGIGERLAARDATGVSLVPTMLRRLLDSGWTPHDRLRFVLLGGAPASPGLIRDCERADVPVYPTYGTTETASQVATATPEQAFEDPHTVGGPLVVARVTLVDPGTGRPVEAGAVGELVVDGPLVTPGYLDDAATEEAFGEHGLHTGDLARRDDRGWLEIVDRVDDAIQTGGETVHPGRVADALRSLSSVSEAAVVGVPDEEWGERVVGLVVPAEGASPTTDAVRDALRSALSPHELPREIRTAAALPRTDSGTVDREAVRERFRP